MNTLPLTAPSVRNYIEQNFDAKWALATIEEACEGACYLVGGSLRDSFLRPEANFGDLDIVFEHGDTRIHEALDRMGVPYTLNRRNNRRYTWNRLTIDLFEPATFYTGHTTIESVLSFFDLRINALALHLGQNTILDPLGGRSCLERSEVGINIPRWNSPQMQTDEQWLLLLRLIRVLHHSPKLRLTNIEAAFLHERLNQLKDTDWNMRTDKFPLGTIPLQQVIRKTIVQRTRP